MRIIDLQKVVEHVTDEECATVAAVELEDDLTGGVSGGGQNLDVVIQAVWARYEVGAAGFDHRQHALTKGAEFRGALHRIGVELVVVVEVRLRKHVARVRKSRHPAAVP